MPSASLNFGYPWWLSYGHLAVLLPAVALLLLGRARRWGKWPMLVLGALAAWSAAAFLVMRSFNVNSVAELPTANFLRAGTGRVLDLGAGTGRSSIMVLRARPQATLVASDLFGESFDHHFGHDGPSPRDRLKANLQAAGVDGRATIETADMRKLPFEAASFDAIVSAYAVDHLNRDGIRQALSEAARVVKPGGDFLLILVANDWRTRLAFGPMLSHGGTRGAPWWTAQVTTAGFEVLETGTQPATLYLLLRRPA